MNSASDSLRVAGLMGNKIEVPGAMTLLGHRTNVLDVTPIFTRTNRVAECSADSSRVCVFRFTLEIGQYIPAKTSTL